MSEKPKKTLQDYETEEFIRLSAKDERNISDDKYAAKIVEKIVISFLTIASIGILGFLGNLLVQAITKTH